jgi:esterase/lipase
MEHDSQIRIIDDAPYAVLFLHGITGSPCHFSRVLPLVDALPRDWSYYNLLLPGHGGSVSDFSRSTMKQWKRKVREVFLELADSHAQVVVVGHSMGTLFALQLAAEFPDKIPLLFLIASPIHPRVSPRGMMLCLRAVAGAVRADRPDEMAIIQAGGIRLTRKLWMYIPWARNMIALLWDARQTKKLLPMVSTKAVIFQSRRDEMVSPSSAKILSRYPNVKLTTLDDSTHFYYSADDLAQILRAFSDECKWVQNREVKTKSKERNYEA